MESARPIEPGCLVLIIGATQRYEYIGTSAIVDREDNWYPSAWLLDLYDADGAQFVAYEKYLMRIDDPDLQKQIEREQELVNET